MFYCCAKKLLPQGNVPGSGLEAAESQTIMKPQSLRPLLQLQKQLPYIGTTTSHAEGRFLPQAGKFIAGGVSHRMEVSHQN